MSRFIQPISCLKPTQPEVHGSSTLHPSLLSASQFLSSNSSNTNSQKPTLESVLEEQRVMMHEFKSMKDMLQATKQEMELMRTGSGGDITAEQSVIADQPASDERVTTAVQAPPIQEETVDLADDDDDTRSIITIMPHELETIDEVDEEKEFTIVDIDGTIPSETLESSQTESRTLSDESVMVSNTPEGDGSDTPPPRPSSPVSKWLLSSTELDEQEEAEKVPHIDNPDDSSSRDTATLAIYELTTRLSKLEASLAASVSFQDQNAAVQSTVSALGKKISSLENLVQTTQAKLEAHTASAITAAAPAPSPSPLDASLEHESLVQMFESWKQTAERQWLTVREECEQERKRLQKAREELELQTKIIQVSIAPEMIIAKRDDITPLAPSLYLSSSDCDASPVVSPPSPPTDSDDECPRKPKQSGLRGRSRREVEMAAASLTAPNLISSSPLASDVEEDQIKKESHTSTIMGLLTPNLSRKSSESDSTLTHMLKEARGFEESHESVSSFVVWQSIGGVHGAKVCL